MIILIAVCIVLALAVYACLTVDPRTIEDDIDQMDYINKWKRDQR